MAIGRNSTNNKIAMILIYNCDYLDGTYFLQLDNFRSCVLYFFLVQEGVLIQSQSPSFHINIYLFLYVNEGREPWRTLGCQIQPH